MAESGNAAVDRGNLVVIGAMSMLWISPVILFWGAVFGPLRPYITRTRTWRPRRCRF